MMDLNVDNVLELFKNLEVSRVLLIQFVKSFNHNHIAGLLYLLESCRSNKKIKCFNIEYEYTIQPSNLVYTLALNKEIMTTERAITTTQPFIKNDYNKHCLLLDVITKFKNNNTNFSLKERILLNNIATTKYQKFLKDVSSNFFPEFLQINRNENEMQTCTTIYQKFLHYIHFLNCRLDTININPRKFRYITRPKPIRIDVTPINSEKYIIQPLYQGYRLIINSNGNNTVHCYNIYGELINALNTTLNSVKIRNATFEAILLPKINNTNQSWKIWNFKTDFALVVVDVFRIEQIMLVDLPYYKRNRFISQLSQDSHIEYTAPNLTLDEIKSCSNNIFHPIKGIVFREKEGSISKPIKCFNFNLITYYDFKRDSIKNISHNISDYNLVLCRVFVDLEIADFKQTLLIYGKDDHFYYTCRFNPHICKFQHWSKIQLVPADILCELVFKKNASIYVVDAQSKILGYAFLRVYFTKNQHVLGYEHKMTSSAFDIY